MHSVTTTKCLFHGREIPCSYSFSRHCSRFYSVTSHSNSSILTDHRTCCKYDLRVSFWMLISWMSPTMTNPSFSRAPYAQGLSLTGWIDINKMTMVRKSYIIGICNDILSYSQFELELNQVKTLSLYLMLICYFILIGWYRTCDILDKARTCRPAFSHICEICVLMWLPKDIFSEIQVFVLHWQWPPINYIHFTEFACFKTQTRNRSDRYL